MKLLIAQFLFLSSICIGQTDSSKLSLGIYIGENYIDQQLDFSQTAQISLQFKRHFISLGPEFKFNFRKEDITNNGLTLNYRFYPQKVRSVFNPYFAFSTQYFNRKDTRTVYSNSFSEETGYIYSKKYINNNRRKSLQFAIGLGIDINITPSFYFSILAKYGLQWDEEILETTYINLNNESSKVYGKAPNRWGSFIAGVTFGYRINFKNR